MRSIEPEELDQSATRRSLSHAQVSYLNITRALAAELVLICHAFLYFRSDNKIYLEIRGICGAAGVVLFFLISGFLITRSAFTNSRRDSYTLSDYMAERFACIYTAYLPTLLSIAAVDYFLLQYPAFPDADKYNLWAFVGNLVMLRGFPVFEATHHLGCHSCWYIGDFSSGHTFWTLPVEWWIYVTFGILFFSIKNWLWTTPRLVVLALASLFPLYSFIGRSAGSLTGVWMMGLGASAVYYWIEMTHLEKKDRRLILCLALILPILAIPMGLVRLVYVQFNVYDAIFTELLAVIVFAPIFALKIRPIRVPDVVRWAAHHWASYSYSLYLFHTTIMITVLTLHPEWVRGSLQLLLLLVVINLIAFCLAHTFELHYPMVARYLKALFQSVRTIRFGRLPVLSKDANTLITPDLNPAPMAAWINLQEKEGLAGREYGGYREHEG